MWCKNRHVDQWKTGEDPDINLYNDSHLISRCQKHVDRKLQQMAMREPDIRVSEKTNTTSLVLRKNPIKVDQRPSLRPESLKLLERNIKGPTQTRYRHHRQGLSGKDLNRPGNLKNSQANSRTSKTFCAAKKTINRVKGQPTGLHVWRGWSVLSSRNDMPLTPLPANDQSMDGKRAAQKRENKWPEKYTEKKYSIVIFHLYFNK